MNEANWTDCLDSFSATKRTPDKYKARSLITTAQGRLDYLKTSTLNKNNAVYIFEGIYTSIIEFIHSLTILEGYKIINHLCLGYYLRDILKNQELFRIFNDCRIKRNSLIYYGKTMDFETCRKDISKSQYLINKLKDIIKSKI